MATTKRTTSKAEPETAEPEAAPQAEAESHSGWAHDWRNPEARFDRSDHCPNALLRRLAPR